MCHSVWPNNSTLQSFLINSVWHASHRANNFLDVHLAHASYLVFTTNVFTTNQYRLLLWQFITELFIEDDVYILNSDSSLRLCYPVCVDIYCIHENFNLKQICFMRLQIATILEEKRYLLP